MPSLDSSDNEDALEFYKSQIKELEAELADFQASSRELETELEKELEASEKQHRELRNKNEALKYEVEEWKNKYKQSKSEANIAQGNLQKEITALREQNREMQLKLRDMEVSNDDLEVQERIVKTSLEDVESKYNHSIERSVMLEEEIRVGEREREALRIEVQRLRDELSDLKVEQEITVEKLNSAMVIAAKYGNGSLHHVPPPKYPSPLSDCSTVLTEDAPCTPITTPSICASTPQSDHSGPPSPPMSEISTTQSDRIHSPHNDPATTPRPRTLKSSKKHHRAASINGTSTLPMPPSRSLNQIRGLIGQMQRLEQRVQSARSKLPGPPLAITPPRLSPRSSQIPSAPYNAITLRSVRKTRTPSISSSIASGDTGFCGRLSFSGSTTDRPTSRLGLARPESGAESRDSADSYRDSRPSSRASGISSMSSTTSGIPQRPMSRNTGVSGIPQRPASRAATVGGGGRYTTFESPATIRKSSISLHSGPHGGYGAFKEDRTGNSSLGLGDQGEMMGPYGFPRRNTLGSRVGGSAIPLPRRSGRLSAASSETTSPRGPRALPPPKRYVDLDQETY
ncbi:hypothetical protein BZA77DRAFT_99736 [Pyronema omphalodes]|nr:hypothetical protein BZA77DRAFT_99736 [Pyronema omphalodes]